jgi:hypothetical protein
MKFKNLNTSGALNESEELWVSSSSSKVPASESKLSFRCNARPLKALLKTLSDPKEIEDAINKYTKTNKVKYAGQTEYNGCRFYRFDPVGYGYDTFWYCRNYTSDYSTEALKHEIPEGSVLVASSGCTMTFYDFYRVERYEGKSAVISKLEKISTGGFTPYVMPGNKAVMTKKYRINVPKDSRFTPNVILGYHNSLYFRKERLYDKTQKYQENHLD